MFLTIAVILIVLWLFGIIGDFGGSLINLLLAAAVIAFILNFVLGRSRN